MALDRSSQPRAVTNALPSGVVSTVVEVVLLDVEVGENRRMHARGRAHNRAMPAKSGSTSEALQAVPRRQVEVARRAVVLGRVAGRYHDPALGNRVAAEHLVLQELQHGGRERFRHAVDLVEEQDALAHAPSASMAVVHRRR